MDFLKRIVEILDAGDTQLVVAIVVSIAAAFVSAMVTILTLSRHRRLTMKMADAITLRDRFIMNSALGSVSEDKRDELFHVLEDAYANASQTWADAYLAPQFGVKEADQIKRRMLNTNLN